MKSMVVHISNAHRGTHHTALPYSDLGEEHVESEQCLLLHMVRMNYSHSVLILFSSLGPVHLRVASPLVIECL
jgi:hypothetical protein